MAPKRRKRRGRNKGWFKKGFDARRSNYRPTREECRRGYEAALAAVAGDIRKHAWLWRKLRGFYRAKGTWYPQMKGQDHGEEKDDRDDPGPAVAGGDGQPPW